MKHWEILKKHMDTYETQQKVLEHALESLESGSRKGVARPEAASSRPPQIEQSMGPVQKYSLMMLMDTLDLDMLREYMARVKPPVYALEYYYHKPISECSLKEVMEGLFIVTRVIGWYDTVDYAENADHYVLKLTHSLGQNGSKVARLAGEILLGTYGTPIDTVESERGIVQTVYKQ